VVKRPDVGGFGLCLEVSGLDEATVSQKYGGNVSNRFPDPDFLFNLI